MAGLVYADNKKIEKPGTAVDSRVNIEIKGSLHPYVSRGGLKLAKALEVFHVDVQGVIAIDVGASTGVYRLPSAKRCRKGICCGCGVRAVGLEAEE